MGCLKAVGCKMEWPLTRIHQYLGSLHNVPRLGTKDSVCLRSLWLMKELVYVRDEGAKFLKIES